MNTTIRGESAIIDAYLAELDAATAHLPADERHDVVMSIEDHIADRVGTARPIPDDVARGVLDDLGPVSSIVAAPTPAQIAPPVPAANPTPPGRAGRVAAIAGVVSLVIFPLLPLAMAVGVFAVIVGIVALVRKQQRGLACVGIVCGLVMPVAAGGLYAVHETGGTSDPTPRSSTAVVYDGN